MPDSKCYGNNSAFICYARRKVFHVSGRFLITFMNSGSYKRILLDL